MARPQITFVRTEQAGGLDRRSGTAEMLDLINTITMRLMRRCPSVAGLTIGSSAPAKVKIANTLNFVIDGLRVTLTTAEYAVPAAAAMANSAGNKEVWLALSSVDGVAVVVTVGAVALLGATAVKPTVPDDAALIGFVKIAAAANNVFTPATTSLAGTGITTTYQDAEFDVSEFAELVAAQ